MSLERNLIFATTHIDTFLDKHGSKVFTGIEGIGEDTEKQKQLTEQVKHAQRLFLVSTSPETFQGLMKTKLSSAHDIAQMSLSAFHSEVSHNPVGPEEAELIHRRAMATSATALIWPCRYINQRRTCIRR